MTVPRRRREGAPGGVGRGGGGRGERRGAQSEGGGFDKGAAIWVHGMAAALFEGGQYRVGWKFEI